MSGSAECSVKFWKLSTKKTLRYLEDAFSHWVVHLDLRDSSQHQVANFLGKNILLTMTKDFITLLSWTDLSDITSNFTVALNPSDCLVWKRVFFTPGMHLFGQNIAFIRQMAMFDTHTVGDADLVIFDANTGQVKKSIHINQKIRKLLAVGEKYALILLPYVNPRFQNLALVDLDQRKIVGGTTVPHSRANNPDFTQVDVGKLDFLDGFDGLPNEEMMVVVATCEASLYMVKWNLQ